MFCSFVTYVSFHIKHSFSFSSNSLSLLFCLRSEVSIRQVVFQSEYPLEVYDFFSVYDRGRTSRISALGLFRTELAALGPHCQDLDQYFPSTALALGEESISTSRALISMNLSVFTY